MRGHEGASKQMLLADNAGGEGRVWSSAGLSTQHVSFPASETPLIDVQRANGNPDHQTLHDSTPSHQRWLERYGGWIVIGFIGAMSFLCADGGNRRARARHE
jgi:hypothetical protein